MAKSAVKFDLRNNSLLLKFRRAFSEDDPFVTVLRFPSLGASADIETLPVGRRIPVPGGERTGSVEVSGRTSHAGNECYRSVWRYDGTIRYEDCITPDTLLKVSATYYTADDPESYSLMRVLVPVAKYRTARMAVEMTSYAMEVLGGNGYVEECFVTRPRRGIPNECGPDLDAFDAVVRYARLDPEQLVEPEAAD